MIEIGGYKVYFGDFHGQWNEDRANPALLVAGLTYYGYDFSVFQGPGTNRAVESMARALNVPITFFPGNECMFDWAHITTWDLRGEQPPLDNPNYAEVLADLKSRSRMVTVAHPYEPFIPKIEGLLEDGLIDAVEIVNGGPQTIDHSMPILKWLRRMQAKGRKIPVVGGMDIHIAGGCQRPAVSYSADYPPRRDIGALGLNRTAVIVDQFTPEAIVDAVKAGRSVVDAGGELLGDPELVRELDAKGYRRALHQAQERLDRITLKAIGDEDLVGCETRSFLADPGEGDVAVIRIMTGPDEAARREVRKSESAELTIPHAFDRNLFHLGASVQAGDGAAKAFALKVWSPAEVALVAEVTADEKARAVVQIVNRSEKPMEGVVSIKAAKGEGLEREPFGPLPAHRAASANCENELGDDPSRPVPYTAEIELSSGLRRNVHRELVFMGVPYLDRDEPSYWGGVPDIVIGYEDQLDDKWTSEWRGSQDASARVKVAWNEQGLYFRALVVDDVLCPSPRPAMPMFGDSLQIGINPIHREDLPAFSVYDFFLTRHLQGDRLLLDRSPRIACEGVQPPSSHKRMPEALFSNEAVSPTETLCRVNLPWHLLIPMQPVAGYRFGLFLILWDNDGSGCKASLEWPKFAERDTGSAWYAVAGGAWAQMELLARRRPRT